VTAIVGRGRVYDAAIVDKIPDFAQPVGKTPAGTYFLGLALVCALTKTGVAVMIANRLVAFGLVLMSGAAAAHAQTVVTRQIREEPVETTIVRGPNGTVITKRPLDVASPRVAAPVYAAPGYGAPGYGAPGYVGYVAPTYVAPAYDAVQVRPAAPVVVIEEEDAEEEVSAPPIRRMPEPVAAPAARSRTVARRGTPPIMARQVEPEPRPAARVRRASAPLALRPAEREVIYRTIVRERVYAPPAVDANYAVAPAGAQVVGYVASPFAVVTNAIAYVVGVVVPQTVTLVTMPQVLAVQVPATRGYQYAVINNRVLLVDPATSIVVADVTQ
jgi:hypothetical protein